MSDNSKPPDFWKVGELAEHWEVSAGYVYRLVSSGELKYMKMGKAKQAPVRIPNAEVERFEQENLVQ